MSTNFLWVEKYRPQKISETILPPHLQETFQKMVDAGELQNMLFTGTAGLGKNLVLTTLLSMDPKKVTLIRYVARLNSLHQRLASVALTKSLYLMRQII